MMWFWARLRNEGGFAGPKDEDPTGAEVEGEAAPESSTTSGVQVDLKETEKAPEKGAAPKPEVEDKRLKALESQVAATRRINESHQRTVQELNTRLQQGVQQAPAAGQQVMPQGASQAVVDQYDQLVADGKWQDAVRLLAREVSREEIKTTRQIETAEEQVRTVQQRRLTTLEKQKQMVESLYPALHRETGDPDAPETQLFNAAIAQLAGEDEQFLHDPYAPQLAMHRMEQLAATQGIKLTKAMTQISSPARPGRGASSMPVSRGAGGASSSTYQLSADQKEWCDANLSHLPEAERYKHYARFAKVTDRERSIEA